MKRERRFLTRMIIVAVVFWSAVEIIMFMYLYDEGKEVNDIPQNVHKRDMKKISKVTAFKPMNSDVKHGIKPRKFMSKRVGIKRKIRPRGRKRIPIPPVKNNVPKRKNQFFMNMTLRQSIMNAVSGAKNMSFNHKDERRDQDGILMKMIQKEGVSVSEKSVKSRDASVKPHSRPGDNGEGVTVPINRRQEAEDKFRTHMFNVVVSDIIPLDRTVPDFRSTACREKEYPPIDELPTTSIVIVFHKEAWSTLIRTVTSIINRSPHQLIKEIIMVDDNSETDELGDKLDQYVTQLPVTVKIVRLPKRCGLIKARLEGAAEATGDTLTFLDAHCECSNGWLEPLLSEIYNDRTVAITPIIDTISLNDFTYQEGFMSIGGFDSNLIFSWIYNKEPYDTAQNWTGIYTSPTMAGGLFSIDRKYFYEIGSYDEGMRIWGIENVEISLRIWMCGGKVYNTECSHVGHVFRNTSPYSFPGGNAYNIHRNLRRMLEVWLDDYKLLVYKHNPSILNVEYGDVTLRHRLRKRLKCRNFRWFIENVYPSSPIPAELITYGEVFHTATELCLDTMKRMGKIVLKPCHHAGGNQFFVYTKQNALQGANYLCLDAAGLNVPAKIYRCHGQGGNQKWMYNRQSFEIKHTVSEQCLSISRTSLTAVVEACDGGPDQQWLIK